jgi:hypothetical protein
MLGDSSRTDASFAAARRYGAPWFFFGCPPSPVPVGLTPTAVQCTRLPLGC